MLITIEPMIRIKSNKTGTNIYLFDIKRGFLEKISLPGHFCIIHFTFFAKSTFPNKLNKFYKNAYNY